MMNSAFTTHLIFGKEPYRCPNWHLKYLILTFVTNLILTAPILTLFRNKFFDTGIMLKCVDMAIADNINAAAIATISTIWATFGNKLLAAKRNFTVATVTCLEIEFYEIKHIFLYFTLFGARRPGWNIKKENRYPLF